MSGAPTKYRLIAGTINHYESGDGWQNVHLDVLNRPIHWSGLGILVQPDLVMDASEGMADLGHEKFDEVRMHHVLEHMTGRGGAAAVEAAFRVLKQGGVFDVEVPDLDRICDAWTSNGLTDAEVVQWLYGEDLGDRHSLSDCHRYAYNEESLRDVLGDAGFVVGEREPTGLAVRFLAVKP